MTSKMTKQKVKFIDYYWVAKSKLEGEIEIASIATTKVFCHQKLQKLKIHTKDYFIIKVQIREI